MPRYAAILLFTLAFGLWPSLGLGSALDSGTTTESIPQPLFRPTLTLKLAKELRTLKETKPQSTITSSSSEDIQPGPVETSTTPASQSVQPLQSADELLRQAELHWQQGDMDQAGALYKAFLDLFPYHPHNHLIMVRLADMLQRKQRLEDALKDHDHF